jgi:hypothetical protein
MRHKTWQTISRRLTCLEEHINECHAALNEVYKQIMNAPESLQATDILTNVIITISPLLQKPENLHKEKT